MPVVGELTILQNEPTLFVAPVGMQSVLRKTLAVVLTLPYWSTFQGSPCERGDCLQKGLTSHLGVQI